MSSEWFLFHLQRLKASDLLPTFAHQRRKGGGECHGLTNGDRELTFNLTSVRGELCNLDQWLSATPQKPSVAAVPSLSFSSLAICMWFRHRLRRGQGGRERKKRKSTENCVTGLSWDKCCVWSLKQWESEAKGSSKTRRASQRLSFSQETPTESGNTQTWLLNLCPVSALSASSQELSIQLLLPGLGSSNYQCSK